ncbi:hypothetical protein EGW08_023070 [Elysia chlorotica]|uniref:Uncharacterized protein n=1 Tax=Elysia chlorotica TaxID=188477 RepID=A0A433SJF9_ELYCH|nr:hypothetical protein EGW08_023070 [Elysia chlorotica]
MASEMQVKETVAAEIDSAMQPSSKALKDVLKLQYVPECSCERSETDFGNKAKKGCDGCSVVVNGTKADSSNEAVINQLNLCDKALHSLVNGKRDEAILNGENEKQKAVNGEMAERIAVNGEQETASFTNDGKAKDAAVNGEEAKDAAVNGEEAKDAAVNGEEAKDAAVNGEEAKDAAVNGEEAKDAAVNGEEAKDAAVNGEEAKDAAVNGSSVNGNVEQDVRKAGESVKADSTVNNKEADETANKAVQDDQEAATKKPVQDGDAVTKAAQEGDAVATDKAAQEGDAVATDKAAQEGDAATKAAQEGDAASTYDKSREHENLTSNGHSDDPDRVCSCCKIPGGCGKEAAAEHIKNSIKKPLDEQNISKNVVEAEVKTKETQEDVETEITFKKDSDTQGNLSPEDQVTGTTESTQGNSHTDGEKPTQRGSDPTSSR